MNIQPPSPQTTLAILLGAHEWPYSSVFHASDAFTHSAHELRQYLLDPSKFKLPKENLLDLFDTEKNPYEIDKHMRQFLEQRISAAKSINNEIRDILIYFVGHGDFVGASSEFYLAVRCTEVDSLRASGIAMASLADTIAKKARNLRRVMILDCCFSAAAMKAFQAGPDQIAIEKTTEAFSVKDKKEGFPGQGTTLLCSSGAKLPSRLLPDESFTMFSKALLDVLFKGKNNNQNYLSLRDVKDLATNILHDLPTRDAPQPVLLSPDQSEGDVADIPFFPNLATISSQASSAFRRTALRTVRVLACYADEDENLWDEFQKHLMYLERLKEISLWSYRRYLMPGQERSITERAVFDIAEVVLLLISPDFIASDYCYNLAMQVLKLHEEKKLHAIPILLRPVPWKELISDIEVLPRSEVAVTSWMNRDEAFLDVTTEIHKVTNSLSIQRSEEQWWNQGKTYYFTNRYKEALDAYEKALRVDPENATIHSYKAIVLLQLGHYEEALSACEKAIDLYPNEGLFYRYKSSILWGLGRSDEAEKAKETAKKMGYVDFI